MKKKLFWGILAIVLLSFAGIWAVRESIRKSPILKESDLPGYYLVGFGVPANYAVQEVWATMPKEQYKATVALHYWDKAEGRKREYSQIEIIREYSSVKVARENMGYTVPSVTDDGPTKVICTENSPSGRRYGDISKTIESRNIPDLRTLRFAKGDVYVRIHTRGKGGQPVPWELIEKVAGIIESRL